MTRVLVAVIAAAACVHSAHAVQTKRESAFGLGWGIYQGPTDLYIAPTTAPGLVFSTIWIGPRVGLVSQFEVGPLIGGERFAGATSGFVGVAVLHRFHPKFFIYNRDGFRPYLAAGTILGAYGLFLTELSTSQTISNNQASLKYGFSLGIGGDFRKGGSHQVSSGTGGETHGNGFGIHLEYFRYLPTLKLVQFQGGNIEARGLHLTLSWIFGTASDYKDKGIGSDESK